MCPDQDKQVLLIAEVDSYWVNNSQITAIAIDRMMGYRLVSNLAIVRWVFSPSNIEQFHTSDRPWEILRNAVSKTYNRICDLRKELSFLKKAVISAEEAAKAELDVAESKLTLVDGEPVLGETPVRMRRLKSHAEKTQEEEALFISLYKNFANVLTERLPKSLGTLRRLKCMQEDTMAVDLEETSQMEVDDENGRTPKR